LTSCSCIATTAHAYRRWRSRQHYPNLPRMWRWGLHPVGRVLQVIYPPIMIESSQLGKACVELVLGRGPWDQAGPEGVLENDVLRKM